MDYFRDARSFNEKNAIQLRVLYSQALQFESKMVKLKSKPNAGCMGCSDTNDKCVIQSAAQQNLKHKIEKVILHFHGGAFVCMSNL